MENSDAHCIRAGIEMTKAQWFALPLKLRQRYWEETDYGKQSNNVSSELVALIREKIIGGQRI
jgi:hypothetical protein